MMEDSIRQKRLSTKPLPKNSSKQIVEKVHFQIEVDDVSFIDKLSIHASINGGSLHQDERGKKYLFYLVKSEGQQEMCLLHEKECNLYNKVAYQNGEWRFNVTGKIFYKNNQDGNLNINDQNNNNHRTRKFIVVDNMPMVKVYEIQKNNEILRLNSKNPLFCISSDTDMDSGDKALLEIGNILKSANLNFKDEYTIKSNAEIILTILLTIGVISIALICFWVVMEAYSWDFKIYLQILIYLGFIIAIIIVVGLIYAGLEKLHDKYNDFFTRSLFWGFQILFGTVSFGLFIWKLVTVIKHHPQTYQQYLWYTISYVIVIPIFITDYRIRYK
ncbi:hypothetical protein FGO68_gene11667 [Halteria grandinella]|uniref:Uncharacterized protein n=1 Tax=Halteria grandinella TaxID=5974 RepID=A0A8J8NNN3_HALGN|nr:hypothetical protein FGO68_gene11667 [Halteria grandinella]